MLSTTSYRSRAMPKAVIELAARLGARTDATLVHMNQSGQLRGSAQARLLGFTAREVIQLRDIAFEWRASVGRCRMLKVSDTLTANEARSKVALLGAITISDARANCGLIMKAQLMRYLAELPWAPDAILLNHRLFWMVHQDSIRVTCEFRGAEYSVDFRLNGEGRICSVDAPDRPRWNGSGFVEQPWHGTFADYQQVQGRWLPHHADVGWARDGSLTYVWHAKVNDWRAS